MVFVFRRFFVKIVDMSSPTKRKTFWERMFCFILTPVPSWNLNEKLSPMSWIVCCCCCCLCFRHYTRRWLNVWVWETLQIILLAESIGSIITIIYTHNTTWHWYFDHFCFSVAHPNQICIRHSLLNIYRVCCFIIAHKATVQRTCTFAYTLYSPLVIRHSFYIDAKIGLAKVSFGLFVIRI